MWIVAAFSGYQPPEPEHCRDPTAVDTSADDLPAHVCAGIQWRKNLFAKADDGIASIGAGRGGIPDRRQNDGRSDHDFHPAVLSYFIHRSIFLPRRALPVAAVCALSHAV